MIFDDGIRSDATPRRFNESRFAFYNRSGSIYYEKVRNLIEQWISHVPEEHRTDLAMRLRSDDLNFEAAFWELYLHEAYTKSGFTVDIHPLIQGSTKHPDFEVSDGKESWYLEAVSVGAPPEAIGSSNRLNDVYDILDRFKVVGFKVIVSTYSVGARPPATRNLKSKLASWIEGLDPDKVVADYEESSAAGYDRLPSMIWDPDDWLLEFHAAPLKREAWDRPRSALGGQGPGEAVIVDNVSGIRRVLDKKYGRYGSLDAPLVVAVQSNTEYPTQDYEVEQALYGLSIYRPSESARRLSELMEDGFWLSRSGWRRGHVPQIVTVHGLLPSNVVSARPRVWTTLEPNVDAPTQPEWVTPMIIGSESLLGSTPSLAQHFGLEEDWPGAGWPDFSPR